MKFTIKPTDSRGDYGFFQYSDPYVGAEILLDPLEDIDHQGDKVVLNMDKENLKQKHVSIYSWWSTNKEKGGTRKSLQNLKNLFDGKISVIDIGTKGVNDSYNYWVKMKQEGLVDDIFDDEGNKVLLRKKIRESLLESAQNLDLSGYESIVLWLENNGPEQIFDENGSLDFSYTDPMTGMDLEELIYTYKNQYVKVISEYDIEIYRLVLLKDINDLNIKNIGVFWSFEKDGVGAYGATEKSGKKPFVLNAQVKIEDINWEAGLYSFIAYGKSEFECNMKKSSEISITKINDTSIEPIQGFC